MPTGKDMIFKGLCYYLYSLSAIFARQMRIEAGKIGFSCHQAEKLV
jgi:hypothetical protein